MNKSKEINMTSGSLMKNLLLFSVPLMFSNLLQVFFNMADVAVVGRFAGAIALGSVGSTTILVMLYTGILLGISGGINSIVALFIGAKNNENLRKTIHTSFVISIFAGFVLMIAGIIFTPMILRVMNTKDELIDGAVCYLRIYLCGAPALSLYNYGNAVLSAAGDTKRPLRFLTIAGLINVVLNVVFVVGLKKSVDGVAFASIISQYVSAILIIACLVKEKGIYRLNVFDTIKKNGRNKIILFCTGIDKGIAGMVLKIGIPAAIQYSLFAFANIFVQTSINSFDHIVVEGHSAASNADTLIYDMMAAFYTACTSFIAQNFGAGNKKRIMKTYIISTFYAFMTAFILGGLLVMFSSCFLGFFTKDADVIYWGQKKIAIMGFSYCISAFMDNAMAASRGIGKSILPTVFVIAGSVVFRIIWLFTVFEYFKTVQSIYLLYPVSWILTAIAENIYFYICYNRIGEDS